MNVASKNIMFSGLPGPWVPMSTVGKTNALHGHHIAWKAQRPKVGLEPGRLLQHIMHMGQAGLILRMCCSAMVDCGVDVVCYWGSILLCWRKTYGLIGLCHVMDGLVQWGIFTVPAGPGPPMPGNANPIGHPSFLACAKIQVQDLG
jgi:hypothetical protein